MSVDAANEQTTHKDNVCRFNRDEHNRQLLHVALELRIDLNGSSHPCGRMFDEHIKWSIAQPKRQCGQSTGGWTWTAQLVRGIIPRQLFWWMYQLFFGQLSDQQTLLLTHINTWVQRMTLCAVVWSWSVWGLLYQKCYSVCQKKTLLLGSTSWSLKHHCQLEVQF